MPGLPSLLNISIQIAGDIKFSVEKYPEAVEFYTKAIDAEKFDNGFVFELLCSRASSHSKIGNFRDAINDCNRAFELYPSDINMRLLRANCYHYLDEFENSIKDFEAALNAKEVEQNTNQTSKIQTKISDLKNALQKENATKWKCQGDKKVMERNFEAALRLYAEAIDLWPENIAFYEDRANCYMKMKDYNKAIREYQSALNKQNSYSKGYYGMIECYLIIGDVFGAEAIIQKYFSSISKIDVNINAYKRQCVDLRAYENSANDHYKEKRYDRARKLFLVTFFVEKT